MDQKTLAFINLQAILGSLPELCALDDAAKKLIDGKNISIGFDIKGGPSATLIFSDGVCTYREGIDKCTIKLPFASCEKFNGMIDGTITPIPSKGFTKLGFLLHEFTQLTDILTKYLRPEPAQLDDAAFFETSTRIMFRLISSAVAAIGNVDEVGRASASYITDGIIKLEIAGTAAYQIVAKDHKLTAVHSAPDKFTSYMSFADIHTARDLFDGKINAVVAVGAGKVRIGGMISQIDNVNRILDRVSVYLA